MVRRNRDVLIILGFVLMTTLPFINKAFHIDDVAWIALAKAVLLNPSQSLHGQASLTDNDVRVFEKLGKRPRAFERLSHPPMFSYFVALVIHLANGVTERSLHVAYLLFVVLAAMAAYLLGKRFTNHPLFTALFVIATPMFMISSHSVMNDVAMLAFYLMAILTYIQGVDKDDRKQLILSGILIALAVLTRYIAFALLPLLGAYSLLTKRKLSIASMLPFIISLLIYGLWEAQNVIRYGAVHLLASSKFAATFYEGSHFALRTIVENALSDLSYIGGATIFPFALLFIFLSTKRKMIVFAVAFLFSLFILIKWSRGLSLFNNYSNAHVVMFLLFFMTGLVTAYHILEAGIKPLVGLLRAKSKKIVDQNADNIFLSMWFGGMLVSAIFILPFAAARYMLPLLLPVTILFVNRIENVFGERKRVLQFFCISGITLTLLTGFALAYADHIYAGIYRTFAGSLKDSYKTETNQLWFIGDWGFRYYMDQENYAYLWSKGSSPKEGDIVILPIGAALHEMSDEVKSCVKSLGKVSFHSKIPLKIQNDESHAGFYTGASGFLPYSFSYGSLEDFYIFAIKTPNFFIKNLSNTIVEAETRETVGISLWNLKGDIRPVLLEDPPSKITYKVAVPEGASLSFAIALHPDVWKPEFGDGVAFKISARYGDEERTLFSKYIDPKNNESDRKWHDARVDLSEYAGKEILLSLITLPGPADDARYDSAGWGDIEIIPN